MHACRQGDYLAGRGLDDQNGIFNFVDSAQQRLQAKSVLLRGEDKNRLVETETCRQPIPQRHELQRDE